jgi:hypothetical protein
MKKVFLKWLGGEGVSAPLTIGREYELFGGGCPYVKADTGQKLYTDGKQSYWQRIEREVFTAHDFEWFKHVPGEPMPCEPCAQIHFLTERNETYKAANGAGGCCWGFASSIIGWRYADSEQKETEVQHVQIVGSPEAVSAGVLDKMPKPGTVRIKISSSPGVVRGSNSDMQQRDLIAAVDDGHLTPGQKAYINAKEEKVAERLRSEAAKEELKRADHSKSIQDLANANGAVKFEHDHRLGWMV